MNQNTQQKRIHSFIRQIQEQNERGIIILFEKQQIIETNQQIQKLIQNKSLQNQKTLICYSRQPPQFQIQNQVQIKYKDSEKILGQTYLFCILTDFQSITPNTLCRVIETVKSGGIIVFFLEKISEINQIQNIQMDVHLKYKSTKFQQIKFSLFNSRLYKSFLKYPRNILIQDKNTILNNNFIFEKIEESSTDKKEKLEQLKQNLKQNKSEVSPLVQICTTLDQATALLHILDSLKEKNNFTLSLTASRGRGKSSLLGLAAAYCIQNGYSNIYITSPCVFNVSSFFNFLLKGIDQYSWVENVDYEIMQSCEKDLGREIIQINFKKNHRQTIQFVLPGDLGLLKNQWDVLFIDEAAAIPLPVLKKGLKNKNMNNFVILSSTINGYEGTGRSLSLKLITELKKGEKIKEITLEQPIRYNQNDVIEHWLNEVMLLEACNEVPLKKGLVHPNECELFYVNKQTLFSYKNSAEEFLFKIMSLFVSSHYKNSPNDLQLIADAPGHQIFILLDKNIEKNSKDFPDVLCAVQVALEGGISEKEILIKQEKSSKPNGDLVPWVLQEQFLDNQFPQGLGVRIVRIASHPSACRMGYGSKCLELLTRFFQGEIISLDENESTTKFDVFGENQGQIQRLLGKLTEANIPKVDYLSVSFGLNNNLFKFWQKNGFESVYLKHMQNNITGEHSCIMVKKINQGHNEEKSFEEKLQEFKQEFKKRFLESLQFQYKGLDVILCSKILKIQEEQEEGQNKIAVLPKIMDKEAFEKYLNAYDMKRIEAYVKSLADFDLIKDLLSVLCKLYYLQRLPNNAFLSEIQNCVFIGLGFQHKNSEQLATELNLPEEQILAIFNKGMRKFAAVIENIFEKDIFENMKDDKVNLQILEEKMLPQKNDDEEIENEGMQYVQDKQGKKNIHARYNFNIDDLEIQKDAQLGKSGTVVVARKQDKAFNQEFLMYKGKKKVKKN